MHRLTSIAKQIARGLLPALLLAAAGGGFSSLHGQEVSLSSSDNILIEEGGEIWIEGSASIVDYTCRARQLSGSGAIENTASPTENIEGEGGGVRITVSIPVRNLECGRKAMNRDMYGALKSDRHPQIRYRLLEAGLADSLSADPAGDTAGWMAIRTRGILEIAGKSDTTDIVVRGMLLEGDRFRVRGSKELSMDTYDITPPSALMGLIRADKQLTVHFDVTVRLRGAPGNGG